jgi:hypothetical protein
MPFHFITPFGVFRILGTVFARACGARLFIYWTDEKMREAHFLIRPVKAREWRRRAAQPGQG